jgi:hypothetical protein
VVTGYLPVDAPQLSELPTVGDGDVPFVTVQLPVYSKAHVIGRLSDACAGALQGFLRALVLRVRGLDIYQTRQCSGGRRLEIAYEGAK